MTMDTDSSQDDDSEPISRSRSTHRYVAHDGDHHKADVLSEYFIIDGPEKEKENTDTVRPIISSGVKKDPQTQTENQSIDLDLCLDLDLDLGRSRSRPGSRSGENALLSSHTKDKEKSSSLTTEIQTIQEIIPAVCPPVNCKEKIIICLDLSKEMSTTSFRSRAGDKYSGLDVAIRALKMFVMHKSQMNPAHEFSFMIFNEEPTVIQGFSSRPQDLLNTLEETEMFTQECGSLSLSKLFDAIQQNILLPNCTDNIRVLPPPFIVRLLLVFGRSQSVPIEPGKQAQQALESSPHFFTDVLYIHDPPSDDNKCEEIFNKLCELDHTGLSYIFEASKYTPIFTSVAKLLSHPLQRPLQEQATYKIGSFPIVQMIDGQCI